MNCRTLRGSGGLPTTPEQAQALSEHLGECPACMDELGQLPQLLMVTKNVIPPPDLAARIMAQLPASPALALQRERSRQWRRTGMRVALGLLVLALVVVGALGVFVDSSVPAGLLGGGQTAGGRLLLGLTLAAKPIIAVFSSAALPLIVALAVALGLGNVAWRRLARPVAALVAIDLPEGV